MWVSHKGEAQLALFVLGYMLFCPLCQCLRRALGCGRGGDWRSGCFAESVEGDGFVFAFELDFLDGLEAQLGKAFIFLDGLA